MGLPKGFLGVLTAWQLGSKDMMEKHVGQGCHSIPLEIKGSQTPPLDRRCEKGAVVRTCNERYQYGHFRTNIICHSITGIIPIL
jgi:hypothetical protein